MVFTHSPEGWGREWSVRMKILVDVGEGESLQGPGVPETLMPDAAVRSKSQVLPKFRGRGSHKGPDASEG